METKISSSESTKNDNSIGLYRRIVEGLEQKPAYLLVFAVSALFVLSGIGSSTAAVVNKDIHFGILAIVSFALALIAVVVIVRQVEPNLQVMAHNEKPLIIDLEILLKKYLNEYFYPHTPKAIVTEAPKITKYQEIGKYSIDEVCLVLDALVGRGYLETHIGEDGQRQYNAFD